MTSRNKHHAVTAVASIAYLLIVAFAFDAMYQDEVTRVFMGTLAGVPLGYYVIYRYITAPRPEGMK